MRVFLSHSSAQRREAERITEKLRSRGFEVFYSGDSIAPGKNLDSVIEADVRRCDAMIFLLSSESVAKSYARTELEMARKRWPNPGDRVLGVLIGAVPTDDVPDYLRDNVQLLTPHGDL